MGRCSAFIYSGDQTRSLILQRRSECTLDGNLKSRQDALVDVASPVAWSDAFMRIQHLCSLVQPHPNRRPRRAEMVAMIFSILGRSEAADCSASPALASGLQLSRQTIYFRIFRLLRLLRFSFISTITSLPVVHGGGHFQSLSETHHDHCRPRS